MPAQQHVVVIIHAAPYGSERCLSGLRVANTLAARADMASVRVFLMSDATVAALPLIDGVAIGTLPELGDWIAEADKVLTF